jgi:hypothetical protein
MKLANLYASQSNADSSQAMTHYIIASALQRHASIFHDLPLSLSGISEVFLQEGDVISAAAVNDVAMEMFRGMQARRGIGDCLRRCAEISIRAGDIELARQQFEEALDWCMRATDKKGVAKCEKRLREIANDL